MDEYEIIEKNRTEKINIILIFSDSFVKKNLHSLKEKIIQHRRYPKALFDSFILPFQKL